MLPTFQAFIKFMSNIDEILDIGNLLAPLIHKWTLYKYSELGILPSQELFRCVQELTIFLIFLSCNINIRQH